ncbi:hypothetical protein J2045_003615 [Peteryoungia aggregata LMG 23059]|uniref:Uncharacterized protein n=1 Tax=Peteryoungia aggregata LMG 23059 TaxID=1368425 RepID=A0ABU0GB29_9HYPH|nr:hypothetical protein [Peteryoungia aggregata]MDQ0422567.1 hypothetical protein [Peteryoungia aggregata LMG 23059]
MSGIADRTLEAIGRSRRIVLGLPSFLPALAAVAQSGAIVTLPRRVAEDFCQGLRPGDGRTADRHPALPGLRL